MVAGNITHGDAAVSHTHSHTHTQTHTHTHTLLTSLPPVKGESADLYLPQEGINKAHV